MRDIILDVLGECSSARLTGARDWRRATSRSPAPLLSSTVSRLGFRICQLAAHLCEPWGANCLLGCCVALLAATYPP